MGKGYWVLVWDGWGAGLVMLNPRLLVQGVDQHDNPRNWWPADAGLEAEEIVEVAIRERRLPWLDGQHAPPDEGEDEKWHGGPRDSTDYRNWKVIVG